MTEKELKKLNRQELLEVLLAQSKKIDRLQAQLKETKEKLAEKELMIEEAGSIAEASLVLNNIFADAQKAADQYLYNIRLMHEKAKVEFDKGEPDVSDTDGPVAAAGELEVAETSATEPGEAVELSEIKVADADEEADVAEERAMEAKRLSEEAQADRLAAAEAKAAAEADRKSAEEYLAEVLRMREQTELECAEQKMRTDKQIRMSLIRTKKAVGQMMTLYADEVMRRLKRLKEWDRQMEALHERKNKKQSSTSQ